MMMMMMTKFQTVQGHTKVTALGRGHARCHQWEHEITTYTDDIGVMFKDSSAKHGYRVAQRSRTFCNGRLFGAAWWNIWISIYQ